MIFNKILQLFVIVSFHVLTFVFVQLSLDSAPQIVIPDVRYLLILGIKRSVLFLIKNVVFKKENNI